LNYVSNLSTGWSLALLAAAFVVVYLVVSLFARRRAKALTDAATQLGFTYNGDKWLDHSRKPQLETWLFLHETYNPRFENIIFGNRDGLSCNFFDYSFTMGKSTIRQTVARFTQDVQIPSFALAPQDILHKVSDAVLHKAIQFESDPDFSKRYRLVSSDEEKARALFTPELLSFVESLDASKKWHVEGAGTALVVYRRGKTVRPEEFAAFVEQTTQLAKSFLSCSGLKKPSVT
jgi:hypothetical protein